MPATWRPRKPVVKTKPRLIVHLGNIADEQPNRHSSPAEKTRKYAERFKGFQFVGIDRLFFHPTQKNWKQIQTDFLTGLLGLKKNSADVISSEMALGHLDMHGGVHNVQGYTLECIKTAYEKLKPKGKLMIVVAENVLSNMQSAFDKTPFQKENVRIYELTGKALHRTYWTTAHRHGKTYQIIAQK